MKRVYWYSFWSLAILHFVATVVVVMKRFTMGMTRFDSAEPTAALEGALGTAQRVILFPVGSVGIYQWFQGWLNGVLGWLPIVLNSMLWAAVILGVIMLITRALRSQNNTSELTSGGRADASPEGSST